MQLDAQMAALVHSAACTLAVFPRAGAVSVPSGSALRSAVFVGCFLRGLTSRFPIGFQSLLHEKLAAYVVFLLN